MEDVQGGRNRWLVQGYVGMLQALLIATGTTAHFFRIFPHTVVTLVANEVSGLLARSHGDLPQVGLATSHATRLTFQLIMAQYRKFRGDEQVVV
jgi:hypothetical protein